MDHGKTASIDEIRAFYDSAISWWGESWYEGHNLAGRLALIERMAGKGSKRVLDLGAGSGETASYLAARGYKVTAVDASPACAECIRRRAGNEKGLEVYEGDFLSLRVPGTFDAVCLFESFGLGTDSEQRALLSRIAEEWLAPGGCAIVDVYHPYGPTRENGTSIRLDRLEGIPGSVDMTEYTFYDGVEGRWIDLWEPVGNKEASRRQSIRCYTPADLALLLDGTGMRIDKVEFESKPVALEKASYDPDAFMGYKKNYAYQVRLVTESSF
jgi:SAM-dependent methyltransferase